MSFIFRWLGYSPGISDPRHAANSQALLPTAKSGSAQSQNASPAQSARRPIRRKDLRPVEGCRPHTLDEFCFADESNPALSPSQLSILFFAGKSINAGITKGAALLSTRSAQAAEFSHVGVVHLWQGGVIGVFESVRAKDPLPDALSGIPGKTGVRLVQLRDKIIYYASQGEYEWENPHTGERVVKIGLLRFNLLKLDPSHDMVQVQNMLYEAFCVFQRMESEKTFSQSALEMAQAGVPELFGDGKTNTHEYFCSSLVARTFVALGALPRDYPVSSETPGSLATSTLPMLAGAEFQDELIVAYVSVPRDHWDPHWVPGHHQQQQLVAAPISAPPPSIYPQSYVQQQQQQLPPPQPYYATPAAVPAAAAVAPAPVYPYDPIAIPASLPAPIAPTKASDLYAQGKMPLPVARQTVVEKFYANNTPP